VNTYLGEIHSRATQSLEAVRQTVNKAGDTTTKKLSDISAMLKSQAEGLGKQLETQAGDLKTKLEGTAKELRSSLQGKIDELTEVFTPYATQIREQVENMMETVKKATGS